MYVLRSGLLCHFLGKMNHPIGNGRQGTEVEWIRRKGVIWFLGSQERAFMPGALERDGFCTHFLAYMNAFLHQKKIFVSVRSGSNFSFKCHQPAMRP